MTFLLLAAIVVAGFSVGAGIAWLIDQDDDILLPACRCCNGKSFRTLWGTSLEVCHCQEGWCDWPDYRSGDK